MKMLEQIRTLTAPEGLSHLYILCLLFNNPLKLATPVVMKRFILISVMETSMYKP